MIQKSPKGSSKCLTDDCGQVKLVFVLSRVVLEQVLLVVVELIQICLWIRRGMVLHLWINASTSNTMLRGRQRVAMMSLTFGFAGWAWAGTPDKWLDWLELNSTLLPELVSSGVSLAPVNTPVSYAHVY